MAHERRLNLSEIILLAMTRGMLGAGVGLLAAGKLNHQQRIAIGRTLILVGAVTHFRSRGGTSDRSPQAYRQKSRTDSKTDTRSASRGGL